ncbi:MAG TPA: hypothetical protein VLV83_15435 [Acidobacteriota bacterium]|nr:hypothetical protein [Acidobacteriota bacterium]
MIIFMLLALLFQHAADPDGLRRRVMRSVENGGWTLRLRLDRDVLLSRVERRLLAEVELMRPRPGTDQARLTFKLLGLKGRPHQVKTLSVPCDPEGILCRLRWEVEPGVLPLGRYWLALTWPEGPEMVLQMPFRVQ